MTGWKYLIGWRVVLGTKNSNNILNKLYYLSRSSLLLFSQLFQKSITQKYKLKWLVLSTINKFLIYKILFSKMSFLILFIQHLRNIMKQLFQSRKPSSRSPLGWLWLRRVIHCNWNCFLHFKLYSIRLIEPISELHKHVKIALIIR